jgi:hypothetical protein
MRHISRHQKTTAMLGLAALLVKGYIQYRKQKETPEADPEIEDVEHEVIESKLNE